MPALASRRGHRPRELRRRVLLPARLRTVAGWSDACILNVSSRGLLIKARQSLVCGSRIELRHDDEAIVATVIWRSGSRAGLQAEDHLPVERILLLGQSPALQLTAGRTAERRKRPRTQDDNRLRGRAIEFLGVVIVGILLSSAVLAFVAEAFALPLASVRAALEGRP
ncbi:MAG TPA: hypothetical protein VF079_01165 [Sphingomicrobium sp.]